MTKKTRARQKLKWQRQILLGAIAIEEGRLWCRMESSLNILGIMGALKLRNKSWWMENCSNETLDLGDEFSCINLTGFPVKAARVTR